MSTPTIRRLRILEYLKTEPRSVLSLKKLLKSEFHEHAAENDRVSNIELALRGDFKSLLDDGIIVKYQASSNNRTSEYSETLDNEKEFISLSDQSQSIQGGKYLKRNGCKALIPLVSGSNESIHFHPPYEVKDDCLKTIQLKISENHWIKVSITKQSMPISFIIMRKTDASDERINLKKLVNRFGNNLCVIQVPNKSVSRSTQNRLGHMRIKITQELLFEIEDLGSTNKTHYLELNENMVMKYERYFLALDHKNTNSLKQLIEPVISSPVMKSIHQSIASANTPLMIHVPGLDPMTMIIK